MSNINETKKIPKLIEKTSDSKMSITWSSGEQSEITFQELRFQCRCAECVDEWTRERRISKESIRKDVHPKNIETVGRYAIQIEWSDGHRAGIYPFELLYEIAKTS